MLNCIDASCFVRKFQIFSQEIPSDVTVQAGGAKFSLHKFPLASKCGYIRKLVAEAQDADLSMIDLSDIPGGAEAFELAAKFCYGINFEVSTTNIAMLRCAAEYLQMTEDYANANLVSRVEAYINEVVPKNLSSAVSVLHFCENLLPMAEDLNIVSRCIEVVASKTSKESWVGSSGRVDNQGSASSLNYQIKPVIDWWLEEIVVLRIDFFQRVLIAMKGKGLKHGTVGAALMFYAQKSLRGLDIFGTSRKKIEHEEEQGQRILVETIASLLPTEKNSISVSFLCWLLRTAIYLETTVACKLELEQMIGLQLEQATLDDLLIPSVSHSGDTYYAVDSMERIVVNFIEQEKHCDLETLYVCGPNDHFSPAFTDFIKVANLLENYLAEIAPDKNLSIAKFTGLADLIPEKARTVDDGIYRAIDIYLKAHPSLNELERKKVCSIMDCQKLSREACAHAAQNERLPVQIVVQVLYFEQQRLRNEVSGTLMGREGGCQSQKINNSAATSSVHSPRNEFIVLQQENQDLKLEIARLRMQLSDLEKDRPCMKFGMGRPPQYNKKFLNSVSRKLGKLNPFMKLPDSTIQPKPAKERRHSIS
ncbi:BTB/POZ domain-containing protein SR1IP1 isoform X2 [Cryptomeria japonica]|uniref:BTB/POZ domain-containing protein SR1IP1 isoform X2 n=1 Tax=Cryptomeria japonica TaxID=3369 RepID=UPI0025ABBC52|nr:BTB/POZ domain-containing protein SR1IP1 isoform X2 [Cryptomeria japonica]